MEEKKTFYCRKCMKMLPEANFFDAVDMGLIDSSGKMSVCKPCIQNLYDTFFAETQSLEKALHRVCMTLNIKFSNDAASATKAQITTLLESGKNVNAIVGIYKSKLVAIGPSMDKSVKQNLTYTDVATIFTEKTFDAKEIPISDDVIAFWGKDFNRDDIEYLEREYANFKATHSADSYAEVVLLKNVCYTELEIKRIRASGDDSSKEIKQLQELMKNLAISPNVANATNASSGQESFGMWIADIEKQEPAQWLKTDPRGDIYRDIADTDGYFQKYIVRPLKNFILGSKDFNVEETGEEYNLDEDDNFVEEKEEQR
jgi:hypothetical protein